ncbi:cysteine--tRNA ligase [Anianabacter salinae]|uniref:cysteine--tRNA ligase n=1 Tax=Anianabacter salinae TaxID=2851023 RepID=UPI00225E2A07|nr:cysteine--tRNA ligase [Anianabacter salinae]MBV0911917.1 cysteine--tRNA ligase [Anianabacter salinae]
MTEIRLTNSKTRKKEVFAPLDPADVRMYVCGPTVYDRAHLGNARPVIVFDVLYRLLRHVYGADHVRYVRNFTDVDDRINETALRRQQAGAPGTLEDLIRERSDETIRWYHDDMDALGALRPGEEPRATAYIPQMIAMIEDLVAKGHAYAAEGHVLFAVDSYAKYGALSGRSVDDMIAGARVEVAPYKRNPMDFVLWKPSSGDLPGWESPWGRGRPGWHIECSAMAHALLGESFDIHGGGNDLMFPHHENEIAQSCCAHGHADDGEGFAQVWLHNEMLQVEGKKMSKSLGNFFTVRDLLDQGVPGEVIRFVFLSTHYRKPMDWTLRKATEARQTLNQWAGLLGSDGAARLKELKPGKPLPEVMDALRDDLNTHSALQALQPKSLRKHFNVAEFSERLEDIYASQMLLGFDLRETASAMLHAESRDGLATVVNEALHREQALANKVSEAHSTAKVTKDFSEVDRLKSALLTAGVEVRMSKDGVELVPGPNFDPAKLEGLE